MQITLFPDVTFFTKLSSCKFHLKILIFFSKFYFSCLHFFFVFGFPSRCLENKSMHNSRNLTDNSSKKIIIKATQKFANGLRTKGFENKEVI